MESNKEEVLGIILSNSTTDVAICQLKQEKERSKEIFEGSLVIIKRSNPSGDILSRIDIIRPFNDFFQSGDAWSEPRRKGVPLPHGFSREYVICELKLLREITGEGISGAVSIPPQPSDEVVAIDPIEHQDKIFGEKIKEEVTFNFGTLFGYSDKRVDIPLIVKNIPMHFGVFGVTGSGKSYSMGILLEQLIDIKMKKNKIISYPMIIVDAHGDYSPYVDAFQNENHKYYHGRNQLGPLHNLKRFIFPKQYESLSERNKIDRSIDRPLSINLNYLKDNPRELAEMIVQFYHGAGGEGEKQVSALTAALSYLKEDKCDFNELFSSPDLIGVIEKELKKEEDLKRSWMTINAIKSALDKFYREVHEENKLINYGGSELNDWNYIDDITSKGELCIIDFYSFGAGASLYIQQFFISYLATILLNKFQEYKSKGDARYLIFAIEEAQRYCPSSSYKIGAGLAHAKLRDIATQGRKFGLSLCLITQRPEFVDDVVLSMLNTFIIHRISPGDIPIVKKVTGGLPKTFENKLTNLWTGSAIISGQMSPVSFPLIARIPQKDRKVKHTAGEVNPAGEIFRLQHEEK